jgi:hypothetical protein
MPIRGQIPARRRRARVRSRWTVIASMMLVAGCNGLDGSELAEIRPTPEGFMYRATTTLFYGPGVDSWSERQRLSWLETLVHLNGICPHGYQLVSREVAFKYQSPLGYPVDEITYRGHCPA